VQNTKNTFKSENRKHFTNVRNHYFVTLSLRYFVTLLLRYFVTLLLRHFVTLSLCHFVTLSFCYFVTLSPFLLSAPQTKQYKSALGRLKARRGEGTALAGGGLATQANRYLLLSLCETLQLIVLN